MAGYSGDPCPKGAEAGIEEAEMEEAGITDFLIADH
jgi:hypothetical protein